MPACFSLFIIAYLPIAIIQFNFQENSKCAIKSLSVNILTQSSGLGWNKLFNVKAHGAITLVILLFLTI